MTFTHAVSIIFFGGLILFNHGCAYVGPTTGTDHAFVQGGEGVYHHVSHPRGIGACQCGHWR